MNMSNLDEQYKKELIKSEKWNRWANVIKSFGSVAIAIAIFWAISLPQSILEKSRNMEISVREKATLLIDVLKEKDPETRAMLISALRDFYPDINKRFEEIEKEVSAKVKNDWQAPNHIIQPQMREFVRFCLHTNLDLTQRIKVIEHRKKHNNEVCVAV